MLLGISTYSYGWAIGTEEYRPDNAMDERELVRTCVQFGLRCLQIGDNLPLHTFTAERLVAFKKIVQERELRIETGARKLTDDNLRRYLEICQDLNSPLLRFVIDGEKYEPDNDTVQGIIRNALPELKKRNVTLGIENHDRFKAKQLATIIENINSSHVGICLDCVNSMGAGEGLEHVAGLLAPYTVNLHIKDFKIQRLPHKMGYTILGERIGKGMMNVPYLMGLLSKYGRCKSAVLEQWVPPESLLQDTITKEKAWAEESIQYLLTLPYFKNEFIKQ